jgi:hypothetical protein
VRRKQEEGEEKRREKRKEEGKGKRKGREGKGIFFQTWKFLKNKR